MNMLGRNGENHTKYGCRHPVRIVLLMTPILVMVGFLVNRGCSLGVSIRIRGLLVLGMSPPPSRAPLSI